MSSEIGDVLRDAADYLEKRGWIQGAVGGKGDSACAVGALIEVCPPDSSIDDAVYVGCLSALALQIGTGAIATWNDAEHRTAEQVVKELRAAADAQDGQDGQR